LRILLAQTGYLGDLTLTLPVVQHLRNSFPDATIDCLVKKGHEDLITTHPAISNVLIFDKEGKDSGFSGILKASKRLTAKRYSIALVPPGSIRTAFVVYLARIPRRIGTNYGSGLLLFEDVLKFPKELESSPPGKSVLLIERLWRALGGKRSLVSTMFTDTVTLDRRRPAIQRHLQLLEPLGISTQEGLLVPELHPSAQDIKSVNTILHGFGTDRLMAVAPGSVWHTKQWPLEYYVRLVQSLVRRGIGVALVGGGEDIPLARGIISAVNDRVIDTCGKLTPIQSAELLKRCRVLVTNDSAPMHLASAVGTRCVVILGPTVREFGFTPVGNEHVIMERQSLWCRPCTPHGGERCPIGTHECMTGISVEQVANTVFRLIDSEST